MRRDINPPEELTTPDIFIYQEKRLFRTGFENLQEVYQRREREMVALEDWLRRYRATHRNISLFYEDEDLRIWHIHQPASKEEEFRNIWEGGSTEQKK